MASSDPKSVRLFLIYSHKDEALREELETHLSLLKRSGMIDPWHDRKISAGREWENVIDENLEGSGIILLLVSADLLASDYCYDREMQRALEKHEGGEARVIPVIVRAVDWWTDAPFSRLQALPKDAKPVTSWSNRDEAWTDVAKGIRRAIEELMVKPSVTRGTPVDTASGVSVNVPPRNPFFTGREDVLTHTTRLSSPPKAASPGIRQSASTIIKIATQSPLSGPQAVLGESIMLGTQLAIETLKGSVESAGFRVQLVPFDDQANPRVGLANAEAVISDPEVLIVVGHLNSGVALPCSEVYRAAGLAMISPANTNPVITDRGYPNINRVIGRDDMQGAVAAFFARNFLRAGSAHVIHDKTAYGQGVAKHFQTAADRLGIRVARVDATQERLYFTSLVTAIKESNPDVLYFGGLYDQAAAFLKQARESGSRAVFLGPDGMDSSDLTKIAGRSAVGLHYTTVAGPASIYSGAQQFIKDFRNRFGKYPEPYAAEAYDATLVVLKAVESAIKTAGGRQPTREEVSTAIRRLRGIQGVTGVFEFNEKGDRKPARYFVLRVESPEPRSWGQNRAVAAIDAAPSLGPGALPITIAYP